jgi:catechol 2,3-dioxygenase-like lactoylglutathione lyase family enzyme
MIDHVYISVTDIEKSLAFYLGALKPLGWRRFGNYDAASGPDNVPDLFGIGDHAYVSGIRPEVMTISRHARSARSRRSLARERLRCLGAK